MANSVLHTLHTLHTFFLKKRGSVCKNQYNDRWVCPPPALSGVQYTVTSALQRLTHDTKQFPSASTLLLLIVLPLQSRLPSPPQSRHPSPPQPGSRIWGGVVAHEFDSGGAAVKFLSHHM